MVHYTDITVLYHCLVRIPPPCYYLSRHNLESLMCFVDVMFVVCRLGIFCCFLGEKRPLGAVCVLLLTVWSVAVAHCWGVADLLCNLAAVQARPGFQMW